MSRLQHNRSGKTGQKSGAAALYLVLFTTIILSIIALGFTRVMVISSEDTINNDLSESAYDSALVGIEDAKLALMKYQDCVSAGYTASASGSSCQQIIYYMEEGIKSGSCDTVANVLSRAQDDSDTEGGSVMIQETSGSDIAGDEMYQAYTCVKIQEELEDYRTTLSSTDRVRLIPIRTGENSNVTAIKISWYSSENYADAYCAGSSTCVTSNIDFSGGASGVGDKYDFDYTAMSPPTIGVDLYQTGTTYYLYNLSTASSSGTDHAKVYLYPIQKFTSSSTSSSIKTDTTVIAASTFIENSDKDTDENVSPVNCSRAANMDDEFYCSAYLNLPDTVEGGRAEETFYIRLTLPYGAPDTDVAIQVYTKTGGVLSGSDADLENNLVPLSGVQVLVDSTGRANDVYRRIEARLETVDTYFPYPEFEIQTSSDSGNNLEKRFYATHDCSTAENGSVSSCDDTGYTSTVL